MFFEILCTVFVVHVQFSDPFPEIIITAKLVDAPQLGMVFRGFGSKRVTIVTVQRVPASRDKGRSIYFVEKLRRGCYLDWELWNWLKEAHLRLLHDPRADFAVEKPRALFTWDCKSQALRFFRLPPS